MLERRIRISDATSIGTDEALNAVSLALMALEDFAGAESFSAALRYEKSRLSPCSLATRYAAANSITRRRFDALLRETESVARTGLTLIIGRSGRHDRGTVVAARFLGKSLAASLRRLDNLLVADPA